MRYLWEFEFTVPLNYKVCCPGTLSSVIDKYTNTIFIFQVKIPLSSVQLLFSVGEFMEVVENKFQIFYNDYMKYDINSLPFLVEESTLFYKSLFLNNILLTLQDNVKFIYI